MGLMAMGSCGDFYGGIVHGIGNIDNLSIFEPGYKGRYIGHMMAMANTPPSHLVLANYNILDIRINVFPRPYSYRPIPIFYSLFLRKIHSR